ncbi:hypothetical protein [Crossiella sp. CA198]|uniref:hypothetical protein n=1 Tax=Crossiella sp. CA198 TaxID=3455607 RepID=UPI003F8D17C0
MNLWGAAQALDVPMDVIRSIFSGLGRPTYRTLNPDERRRLAGVVRELVTRKSPVPISDIAAVIGYSSYAVTALLAELQRGSEDPAGVA